MLYDRVAENGRSKRHQGVSDKVAPHSGWKNAVAKELFKQGKNKVGHQKRHNGQGNTGEQYPHPTPFQVVRFAIAKYQDQQCSQQIR